ncbi:hypothetical protein BASA81_017758 [Batrachochytrium salamandrivorans]|nr:hypothetical protein BASA81_017758 [Batrachochytrium salamandrivorans]
MNCDKDSLEFVISRPAIVDRVVMNLFFHPEEDKESEDTEPITKANAMKLFQLQEDGSYVVVIKNSLRFDLVIQHVSWIVVSTDRHSNDSVSKCLQDPKTGGHQRSYGRTIRAHPPCRQFASHV